MSGTAYPPRDAERSPTEPLEGAPTRHRSALVLARLSELCRGTWQTALALFRVRP